jgi:hypothetical protein
MATTPTETTTPTAPAKKRGLPMWALVIGTIIALCAITACLGAAVTLLSPAMNAAGLPDECVNHNPDMDRPACEAWAKDVASTNAYQECFQQGMRNDKIGVDDLYACLANNGLAPE